MTKRVARVKENVNNPLNQQTEESDGRWNELMIEKRVVLGVSPYLVLKTAGLSIEFIE